MEISLWVMYGELRPAWDCEDVHSVQVLLGPQTVIGYYRMFQGRANAQIRLWHVQDDVNLHILRIFEGTFCLMRPILGLTSEYLKHSARQAVHLVYRNNRIWKQ